MCSIDDLQIDRYPTREQAMYFNGEKVQDRQVLGFKVASAAQGHISTNLRNTYSLKIRMLGAYILYSMDFQHVNLHRSLVNTSQGHLYVFRGPKQGCALATPDKEQLRQLRMKLNGSVRFKSKEKDIRNGTFPGSKRSFCGRLKCRRMEHGDPCFAVHAALP